MTDELPPLPPLEARPDAPQADKKRGRLRRNSLLPTSSSDPAFFSSDDDPALDNYIQGRRKRRYVGAWFFQEPASSDSSFGDDGPRRPRRETRQYTRQLDSGVWMAWDGNVDDDNNDIELEPAVSRPPCVFKPSYKTAAVPPQSHFLPPKPSSITAKPTISAAEAYAKRVIEQCVIDGDENVDISEVELTSISDATVAPLSGLAVFPTITPGVPFEQRNPAIRLFLANNRLARIPSAIFNIEHLTLLSVRGNHLQELPPSIGKLKNLRTLNIGQNLLHWLPAELLDLMKYKGNLKSLILHPNPYHQLLLGPGLVLEGQERQGQSGAMYEKLTFGTLPVSDATWDACWQGYSTVLHGRTPVQFSDSAGRIQSYFGFNRTGVKHDKKSKKLESEAFWDLMPPRCLAPGVKFLGIGQGQRLLNPLRRVPSLFELAMATAARATPANELADKLLGPAAPEPIREAARTAAEAVGSGGYTCCVCKRSHVTPTAQWLEWRTIVQRSIVEGASGFLEQTRSTRSRDDDLVVPFIRRGCSWSCIPVRIEEPEADRGSAGDTHGSS